MGRRIDAICWFFWGGFVPSSLVPLMPLLEGPERGIDVEISRQRWALTGQ